MFSWLSNIKKGLEKSSHKISAGIDDIFNKKNISAADLSELEDLLIAADLGYKAATAIVNDFSMQKIAKDFSSSDVKKLLAQKITAILKPCEAKLSISHQPQVILMVGVNGAGKTTTIGKLAHKFKGKKISLIAGDTFRAAAVEQLTVWGERNNVQVYSAAIGADAASLCFDGLTKALHNKDDIVFIDTAGRLQNKTNLTEELKKIIRVIKKVIPDAPHQTLLCLDAATGQNALEQVNIFKEVADVNGLIINKLDGTAKGGVLVAMAYENPTPIYYIGVGEKIDDLLEFNAENYASSLLDL